MGREIDIRDVGPIEHLTIPIPEEGGLVVLRGRNGKGKSHSLQAVQALVGGKSKPVSRDGTLGATVEGLGARLTVGRRANHSGEVEIDHLEGEDPSLLVDPGLKDPAAADARRVQALLRLARAEVDVDAFAALVDGKERLEQLCRPASLDPRSDVPTMAAAIKRDLEAEARKSEAAAQQAFAKADGVRAALESLANAGDRRHATAAEAREAHTQAVREHSALQTRQQQNDAALRSASEARGAMQGLENRGAPEVVDEAAELLAASEALVDELRAKLRDAEAAVERDRERLAEQRRAAEQRARLTKAVEAAAEIQPVSDAEIEAAAQRVAQASDEVDAWVVYERTRGMHDEIAEHDNRGKAASEQGAALREAARGTERVVLEAVRNVCGDDMELDGGRLWVHTGERSGRELFSDLSPGERWRRALDIAVKAVGQHGLLVIGQEGFEAMDPINRAEVNAYARKLGVVILTAECDGGDEIRAEVEPDPQGTLPTMGPANAN